MKEGTSSISGVTYTSAANATFTNTAALVGGVATYSNSALFESGSAVDAYYCFRSGDNKQMAALLLKSAQVDMAFEPFPAGVNC